MTLQDELTARIRAEGPIPVAEVMAAALVRYYHNRDPLGAAGDFTTAPEISQVFGELIGLWAAIAWQSMGAPPAITLAEIGPGRGTLMADAWRAAGMVPAFRQAARIHLVETSPALRQRQRATLKGVEVTWHDQVQDLPDGPLLVIANEFIDALPIRQFERVQGIWRERVVGLDADGKLAFQPGPPSEPAHPLAASAPDGAVAEICEAGQAVAGHLASRFARDGGAALLIDYGYAAPALGDSLQAVRRHRYHSVLDDLGEADLTAHVDFAALAAAAEAAGAAVQGPVTQRDFLMQLGIEPRTNQLMAAAPDKAFQIGSGAQRLIDPREMGTLFKVLALVPRSFPSLPGFLVAKEQE